MLEALEFGGSAVATRGGMLVVLLHGWGDTAAGIASLAPDEVAVAVRAFLSAA